MATSNTHTELLRFSVVGSVDNGKSTLIGRLLLDGKILKVDQLESIKERDHYNLARVTDGLAREREEGITIDVAYRYFQTPNRRYIICDCPGHEEFTPNMCSGTSQVDAAIVIVDATTEITKQTKRHLLISSLLGARSLIICINKLDIVSDPQRIFEKYSREVQDYLKDIKVETHYLPISALQGDNIISKGSFDWYKGSTLLEKLESLPIKTDHSKMLKTRARIIDYSPQDHIAHLTVDSGFLSREQELLAFPGAHKVKVNQIHHYSDHHPAKHSDSFVAGSSLNVSLNLPAKGISLLCEDDKEVRECQQLSAMIIWFDTSPLIQNRSLILKGRYNQLEVTASELEAHLDIETKSFLKGPHEIKANQLARVSLTHTSDQKILLIHDAKQKLELNEMILICPKTSRTLGALIVRDFLAD